MKVTVARNESDVAEPRGVKVTVAEPRGMKVTEPRAGEDKDKTVTVLPELDATFPLYYNSLGRSSGPQAIILLFAHTVWETLVFFKDYLA